MPNTSFLLFSILEITAAADKVQLNFSPESLWVVNLILGFVMFGVALHIQPRDFKPVLTQPRPVFIGLFVQFLLFPLLTFLMVKTLQPSGAVALGMFMVAACPGGNMSNFLSHIGRANVALSVCITAISTVCAIVLTPLHLSVWGSLYEPSQRLLQTVNIQFIEVLKTVALLLGLPLLSGMLVSHFLPTVKKIIAVPIQKLSVLFFWGFIIVAFYNNIQFFVPYFHIFFWIVLVQNAVALGLGYALARLAGLPTADCRSVSFETGVHNTGFGLLLIFTFFGGLGGMALIAAWWGIWDMISGIVLAYYWKKKR